MMDTNIEENVLIFEFGFREIYNEDNFSLRYAIKQTNRNIIYKVYHKNRRSWYALKRMAIPQDEKKIKSLMEEINNFRSLSECPHILNYYGIVHEPCYAIIFMELMDWSLAEVYRQAHAKRAGLPGIKLPENIMGIVAARITNALFFCQSKNIIHRDVKPDNILINIRGDVKLCDFGESRIMNGRWAQAIKKTGTIQQSAPLFQCIESLTHTVIGTVIYWPKEHFEVKETSDTVKYKFDNRVDIWSLGITLLEIVCGHIPYVEPSYNLSQLKNFLITKQIIENANMEKIVIKYLDSYSAAAIIFVDNCLKKYKKRATIDELQTTQFYLNHIELQNNHMIKFINEIK